MPTNKQRVSVVLQDEMYQALQRLSKKMKKSLSAVSHDLIERALLLQEDMYFSKISEERLLTSKKWISHDDAWK